VTPKTTFYLLHELRPIAGGPEDEHGGAFANCWAVATKLAVARLDVSKLLADSGWTVLSTSDERAITRKDVPEESLEYFDQAQIDGTVVSIHTFPPEMPDA
jgi:hypothetical protein